jgi:phosphoenolpyruvate-protein phosphotransferase (PTS system enzyme I)
VLRLIAMTAGSGAELGRSVGVCGEAASDPLLGLVLAGLGVNSLSMAPVCLPDVRTALAEHTLEDCRTLANEAVQAPSATTARAAVAEAEQQL